jgi:hypothetical protein
MRQFPHVFPYVFPNTLRPIPSLSPCPSSPANREPIFVAIPFDLLRKRRAMMQQANVSQGKTKMDKIVRRIGLPCVCRSSTLHRGQVVRGDEKMSMERKK